MLGHCLYRKICNESLYGKLRQSCAAISCDKHSDAPLKQTKATEADLAWCYRYLVPEPIIQYIEEHGLYNPANGTLEDTTPTPAPAPANAKVTITDTD